MKNLFIILLLLPAIVLFQSAEARVDRPVWHEQPLAVPANEKDGHAYKIAIDNYKITKDGKTIAHNVFASIAVALIGDEIRFGSYKPPVNNDDSANNCAFFHSTTGSHKICNGEFFLLHEDFGRFERIPLSGGVFKPELCNSAAGETLVQYKEFYLILDRPVLDKSAYDPVLHAKHIGTWFRAKDQITYQMSSGNVTVIDQFTSANLQKSRFELLCRKQFTDDM